jgi:MFS family permease
MSRQLSPRGLLLILTGLNLFNYLDRFVLPAVLTRVRGDLGLNGDQAGTLATAFMIGYFVTSPFFGYLGDRWPRKWLIAAGILVWSAGTLMTGRSHSYAEMLGWRALVGVGEASYATISPSLISDVFPAGRRNNALTIFYVAIPLGAALGNILGGWVAAHWTWRDAFYWAGAPGLLLALVLLPFAEARRGQADAGTAAPATPRARDVLKLFTIPSYVLVVLGYTAYTFAQGGFAHWAPAYLQEVHGVPVDSAGLFFGATLAVSGLVATLVGGLAATAWQRRNPSGYALAMGLSVLASVPLAFAAFLLSGKSLCMASLAACMFCTFLSTGPTNTLILETVPVNLRASAMALSIFMIHLFGDLWSPKLVGNLADRSGLGHAVLILPVALLVAAFFWLALAGRMRRSRAAPG